jgi:sulfite exporter TauE/SafE
MEAFLLGFSSGTVCLAYCAPVLVPFLLGEGQGVLRNALLLAEFLLGRLTGYLIFAVFAWAVGLMLLPALAWRQVIFGVAYVLLSILLVLYGFFNLRNWCAGERAPRFLNRLTNKWPARLPITLGLLTGFNLCPPFLLALTRAANSIGILGSVRFFVFFFLGTAIYFLPMPFLGAFHSFRVLRTVGRLACGIMGIYYFYLGIVMLNGGMRQL